MKNLTRNGGELLFPFTLSGWCHLLQEQGYLTDAIPPTGLREYIAYSCTNSGAVPTSAFALEVTRYIIEHGQTIHTRSMQNHYCGSLFLDARASLQDLVSGSPSSVWKLGFESTIARTTNELLQYLHRITFGSVHGVCFGCLVQLIQFPPSHGSQESPPI